MLKDFFLIFPDQINHVVREIVFVPATLLHSSMHRIAVLFWKRLE